MKFTVNPVRCCLAPAPQDRCRSQPTRRGDPRAISAACSHHAVAVSPSQVPKVLAMPGVPQAPPEERVSARQSDRGSGPAAEVCGRCADLWAPRRTPALTPRLLRPLGSGIGPVGAPAPGDVGWCGCQTGLIAARFDTPADRTHYIRAAGPPPTTHSRALSASAIGNTRQSPGIRKLKNFVARLIHSTSVTSAARSQSKK